jgi:hypothetical protein
VILENRKADNDSGIQTNILDRGMPTLVGMATQRNRARDIHAD